MSVLRIALGGLAGGVVLFVWGAVSWMVGPWHRMEKLPNEGSAIRGLRGAETGVYRFPWIEHDPDRSTEERRAVWTEMVKKHRDGPVGVLIYNDEGRDVVPASMHLKGFLLYLGASLTAAGLLRLAGPVLGGYAARVVFVTLIGLYAALGKDLIAWAYMLHPMDFSIQMAADSLVSALLLGLILAAVVKS